MKINSIYKKVINDILKKGHVHENTIELTNYQFTVPDIHDNIVTCVKVNYDYMLGEMLWYALGDHSDFIQKFNSTGMNRTSEDPEYFNSAYGDVMYCRHGYNQVDSVIEYLRKKPNGRRAIINISTPDETRFDRLDDMCTVALMVDVRNGKVDMTAVMRSSDAYGCLPYDMAFFTEIQKYIADELGLEYGSYTHFAHSIHLYQRNMPLPWTDTKKKVSVSYSEIFKKKYYIKERLLNETTFQPEEIIKVMKEEKCIKI